jgi:hypothetical protein
MPPKPETIVGSGVGHARTAAHLWFSLVFVVGRWSKYLFIYFITYGLFIPLLMILVDQRNFCKTSKVFKLINFSLFPPKLAQRGYKVPFRSSYVSHLGSEKACPSRQAKTKSYIFCVAPNIYFPRAHKRHIKWFHILRPITPKASLIIHHLICYQSPTIFTDLKEK